mgnify:CR=1 FL=1
MPRELDRYEQNSNMIVDIGSDKLMNTTYTRLAEVYIGDVSS